MQTTRTGYCLPHRDLNRFRPGHRGKRKRWDGQLQSDAPNPGTGTVPPMAERRPAQTHSRLSGQVVYQILDTGSRAVR